MKFLAYLLVIIGVCNLILLLLPNTQMSGQGGLLTLFRGILFIGASIYLFNRVESRKQERQEEEDRKNKWLDKK